MNNFKKFLIVLEVFLLICIIGLIFEFGILLGNNLEKRKIEEIFPNHGVPRINIDLNGVELSTIKNGTKDVKYSENTIDIIDDRVIEYTDVELKGRGNGTWVQDKKPFQIKFKNKVDMLGMGKARKWYLLANNIDSTHLRNKIAIEIEKMLGMKYVIDGKFAELYINEEYEGLYYLTPAVEIGKNSVNLRDKNGILVELDNIYGMMEDYYLTNNGDYLTIKDMVDWENKELAMSEFLDSYNKLELAIKEGDYEAIESLIDIDSWVKYYLLSEFIVNPDAYWTSFYMYKDGFNDTIHAGPGWDFDLAFANKMWGNWMGSRFYSPTETMIRKQELLLRDTEDASTKDETFLWSEALSTTIFDLMDFPEFRMRVAEVFSDFLSGKQEELNQRIVLNANYISEAASIDNKKWNKADFNSDLESVLNWINKRYDYFEYEYGNSLRKEF